jgi:hypothetical protein
MIPDGTYSAVVDEIDASLARLELQAADDELYELVVAVAELPDAGRETGAVLTVEVVDENLVEAEYEPGETTRRRERAQDRFDRLSKRPSDDE